MEWFFYSQDFAGEISIYIESELGIATITASPLCGCLSREARKKTAFSLLASATTKSRLRWMVYVEGVFRWRGLALSRGSALK